MFVGWIVAVGITCCISVWLDRRFVRGRKSQAAQAPPSGVDAKN